MVSRQLPSGNQNDQNTFHTFQKQTAHKMVHQADDE